MINTVNLWDVPVQDLCSKVSIECEMSEYDHAFICGLIKEKKPKKLLEIGVAEGGTTAVIMKCLSMLKRKCEVYSVDLSIVFYHDDKKKTGYEYERLRTYINEEPEITHQLMLGNTIGGQIDTIGTGIDFAIIDTAHCLPGEILDFLCILPYLTKNATIVLHDTNLNYVRAIGGTRSRAITSPQCVATKLLLSAVTADRYIPIIQEGLTNIAAFTISENTYRYIEGLFYLLTSTWKNIPEEYVLKEYRAIFEKHYDKECLKIFDIAVANNLRISKRMELAEAIEEENLLKYRFPYWEIPAGSKVVLYGAGKVGKEVFEAQVERKIYNIVSWVDKKYEQYSGNGLVSSPDSLLEMRFDYIVVTVEREDTYREIERDIIVNGYNLGKPILGPISKY